MSITDTIMLRPADEAFLDERFAWTGTLEAAMVCVTIKEYALTAGLAPAVNELLVRLPAGFPDVAPDMFWFATPVTRTDGIQIPATELTEVYLGRNWQRWSRHIGNGWRPGIDDLRSYFAYIATCVRAAAS